MPVIRVAIPSDANRLAELAERTFRDTFSGANTKEDVNLHCKTSYGESIQAAEIADPALVTLVCEERGSLIAFAQLRWGKAPGSIPGDSPGEIQRLYVAAEWHGKGVARELMEACLRRFEEAKTDTIWLGVWERNPRAISFYRKFGFAEVGDHVFQLGADRQRDIVMARRKPRKI
ncbi:MAG: GNAT family N-acetyltransferase [Elusimicrobiota bacterium]|nr:MAG: GNAT family N-acetyltransferase [Elusimicrobiota bacterium]